ncbi:MAG TPA: hypothetical protein DCQ31_06445 [Bacteroidales bacterium]|nr:hypothetical protein [Bacteroidales bacterium]
MQAYLSNFFIKAFNLKKDEAPKFFVFFFISFSLWFYVSFYFAPANGNFISNFGSQYLPLAYIASGVVGYFISLLYAKIQNFVNPRTLFFGTLVFITLVTGSVRFFVPVLDVKVLSFAVFMLSWPFIQLINLITGGLVIEFLNIRQAKRLFGLIGIGGIISSIISNFLIPVIIKYLSHSYDLLLIGNIGLIVAVYLVFYIYKNFGAELQAKNNADTEKAEDVSFLELFKERYFLLIFGSAIISILAISFTDFVYLSSIKLQTELFNTPEKVSAFIALAIAFVKIGEFTSSYFSNRILGRYGLQLGLTVLPISLAILFSLALAAGLSLGTSSIVFFAVVVFAKAAERTFRRGLDDPSFNILYQPLPNKQKLAIQAKVGIIMQLSLSISGTLLYLIITFLSTDGVFKLEFFNAFYVPILLIWVFLTGKLYHAYKAKIRQILADMTKSQKGDAARYTYGTEFLVKKFKLFNQKAIRMSATLLAETNPRGLERYAPTLLKESDLHIQRAILRNVDPGYPARIETVIEKVLKNTKLDEIKVLAETALLNLNLNKEAREKAAIKKLIKSEARKDKFELLKELAAGFNEFEEEILLHLLTTHDKSLKKSAIKLSANSVSEKVKLRIVELLAEPEYRHLCASVLIDNSVGMVDELDKYFEKDADRRILLKVLEIWAKVGTNMAKALLLKRMAYPDKEVQESVLEALSFCRYQADDAERPIIVAKLEQTVENLVWIMAAIEDLEDEKNTLKLIQSLDMERQMNFDTMFNLLGFIYKPTTIQLIQKNILGENIIFAVEIIENFISQDVKQLIIPVIDNISLGQKIKKLNSFFIIERMNMPERLKAIVLRDYDKLDSWTRARAIDLLGKIYKKRRDDFGSAVLKGDYQDIKIWNKENVEKTLSIIRKSDTPDEIFVCLHHPDELVYSAAAKVIWDENPLRCLDYLQKLSTEKQRLIEILGDDSQLGHLLISERLRYIKRHPLFFSTPENYLYKLAEILYLHSVEKNEEIKLSEENEQIIIILKGQFIYKGTDATIEFGNDDLIAKGLNIPFDADAIVAGKKTMYLTGNRAEYFNLLVDEGDINKYVFDMLQNKEE